MPPQFISSGWVTKKFVYGQQGYLKTDWAQLAADLTKSPGLFDYWMIVTQPNVKIPTLKTASGALAHPAGLLSNLRHTEFETWVSPNDFAFLNFQHSLLPAMLNQVVEKYLEQTYAQNPQYIPEKEFRNIVSSPGRPFLLGSEVCIPSGKPPGNRTYNINFPKQYHNTQRIFTKSETLTKTLALEFRQVGYLYAEHVVTVKDTTPQLPAGDAALLHTDIKWDFMGDCDVQAYMLGEDPAIAAAKASFLANKPTWIKNGLCPECGECGRLDPCGGANCSTHGFYQMKII